VLTEGLIAVCSFQEKKRRIPLLFTPHVRRFILDLLAEFFDNVSPSPSLFARDSDKPYPRTQIHVGAPTCLHRPQPASPPPAPQLTRPCLGLPAGPRQQAARRGADVHLRVPEDQRARGGESRESKADSCYLLVRFRPCGSRAGGIHLACMRAVSSYRGLGFAWRQPLRGA
jgi:hypothetical protein